MDPKIVGILALQGGVIEHINAAKQAAQDMDSDLEILQIRTKEQLEMLDALIIPGGESTVLQKLCEREEMFEGIKKIKNIFGTCAGAIMLAKKINYKEYGQKTLELMDIEVNRNSYGRQPDSFEERVSTALGDINAIFIRAPRIIGFGKNVKVLAKNKDGVLACEERKEDKCYLATCFHPELTTTRFHRYFLEKLV